MTEYIKLVLHSNGYKNKKGKVYEKEFSVYSFFSFCTVYEISCCYKTLSAGAFPGCEPADQIQPHHCVADYAVCLHRSASALPTSFFPLGKEQRGRGL